MMYTLRCLCLLLLACPAVGLGDGGPRPWDPSRLSVPVVAGDGTIPYPEFAIYVMPGQTFQMSFGEAGSRGSIRFGDQTFSTARSTFTAPSQPGLARMEIQNGASGETAVVNVFTLVPAADVDDRGYLNGYRMGQYPATPLRGLQIYRPPTGFVEVTAENANTRISPNFRLGQFVSKQSQGYPKYVALRSSLLLKLEQILTALNHSGHPTSSLVVMSGYRTPWYNQAIGNVPYSRHAWGGAADIYIDEAPADGRMDDLNRDGKVNRNDAAYLADFVNAMSDRGEFGAHAGGLGVYGSTASHGPFIHVDVRGTRARW